jgi:hypothetical protein
MKKLFLPLMLVAGISAQAQKNSIYSFSSPDAPFQWKSIQQFSTANENSLQTIYNGKQSLQLLDAYTRKPSSENVDAGLVAATGYREATKQLFYIPMHAAELRWAQWNGNQNPVLYTLKSPVLTQLDFNKTENQITRMTINQKGTGYALTNDAMHLIEFTTGEKPSVRDLGQLIDAASNGQQSIHNACSSFGGDMVAGDDGNIYLITQRNQIYVFNPEKRIATYLGGIKGLPQSFTSNGAAATENGELVLTCSYGNHPYYIINPANWEARTFLSDKSQAYNMSDLASGSFLARKPRSGNSMFTATLENQIQLYPNPLADGSRLQISLTNTISGNHQVQLIDISGKIIHQQSVNLNAGTQSFYLDYSGEIAKGTYFVKLTNPTEKTIHTSKLIIQ